MKIPHPVLALYPAARGFGWILFDSARSPFDWGTVYVSNAENMSVLIRIKTLFQRFHPRLLVLEAFDDETSRRRPRIKQLCRAIIRLADKSGTDTRVRSRKDITTHLGATRRQDIAVRVAEQIEPLRTWLPKPRPIWVGEGLNMALFNAAACALALYAESDPL